MRILYGVNGEGMGHATRSRVMIDALLENHDVRVVSQAAPTRFLAETLPHVDEIFGPTFAMKEGQIRAGRRCSGTCSPPATSSRARCATGWRAPRVAPGRRDHRLRAAHRGVRPLEPHAARRGRQHQHARPLPPRRRDRRRRARGLHDRQGGHPLDGPRGRRVRGHDLLRAAAGAGVHDARAADRAAGDRGRQERARRAPGRVRERRPER